MKKEIEDIDQLIKETLSKEEAEFYDSLDEQNLIEMLSGLFKTKHKWLIIMMNIVNLAAFVCFIICLVQFLDTENTNELIKWGAGGFTSLMVTSLMKLFAWMQMDKNAILREMKRLELQVSSIAGRQG